MSYCAMSEKPFKKSIKGKVSTQITKEKVKLKGSHVAAYIESKGK
jgi:hypothetical protein